jgi:hypothetical protein
MNDIPDNLIPEEQGRCINTEGFLTILKLCTDSEGVFNRDLFLSTVRRIIGEPPSTEYPPPRRQHRLCNCILCQAPDKDIPSGPYIPLAHR